MLTAAALAAAVIARVPWPVVAILGLAPVAPWSAAAAVAAAAWHAVRSATPAPGPRDEAEWLAAVAAELRAGASLRTALVAAGVAAPALEVDRVVRMASAGALLDSVADEIGRMLPFRGPSVAAALSLAGLAGGRMAAVFERLAADAWEDVEADRTRTTLTAQARLSAVIVGGLPVVAVAALALTGRLSVVSDSGPAGVIAMTAGLILQLVGMTMVIVMVQRGGR